MCGANERGLANGARRADVPPTTTLTILRVRPAAYASVITRVGLSYGPLARVPGARFLRLMGTGHGRGFSMVPHLGQYLLLGVFDDRAAAQAFHRRSSFMRSFEQSVAESYRLTLEPLSSHGAWDGVCPFGDLPDQASVEGPLLVLTRARIRIGALYAFWRSVPAVTASMLGAAAAASVGFGELPWVRQATFSLWPSAAAMRRFAYAPGPHRDVMRRARAERWFAEDLFARFRPIASEGSLHGRDPLRELL